jgi:hypothetical protein
MVMDHYVLDEAGEAIAVDLLTWAEWFTVHPASRVVLQEHPARGVLVSTVFLGLDHGFHFDGQAHPPVLWETMIFGGPFDQFQDRYTSRLEALIGHASAVALVELYRAVPRKTKQALKKWGAAYDRYPSPSLQRGERRRLRRAMARIGWRRDLEQL